MCLLVAGAFAVRLALNTVDRFRRQVARQRSARGTGPALDRAPVYSPGGKHNVEMEEVPPPTKQAFWADPANRTAAAEGAAAPKPLPFAALNQPPAATTAAQPLVVAPVTLVPVTAVGLGTVTGAAPLDTTLVLSYSNVSPRAEGAPPAATS
jgi:hypothetical protein